MKLLIVSHTPHYLDNGIIKGWGATLREIDHLATLFDEVVHVAPLHPKPAPHSALPYLSKNVRHVAVPPAGGEKVIAKIGILWHTLTYLRTLLTEMRTCDVVHVRCPANISMLAIVCLVFLKHPHKRWIKYAGNWKPAGKESLSYSFQRWWLRRNLPRSVVTVNGRWDDSPAHVHAFRNPCLTDLELIDGDKAARSKSLTAPIRFVFVGRVDSPKGVVHALEVIAQLIGQGYAARIDIIGDGPDRTRCERATKAYGIHKYTHFHGWKLRSEVNQYYQDAHFILLPSSSSEGWPKVLSEAMAFGVVPLASNVSSIPQFLKEFGTGHCFVSNDVKGYVEAVKTYLENPDCWKRESMRSVMAANLFSYSSYIRDVRKLLALEQAK